MKAWFTIFDERYVQYVHWLKLQSITFGALAVNKQSCLRLAEEIALLSVFLSMMNHAGTGLLCSGTYPNQSKIVRI